MHFKEEEDFEFAAVQVTEDMQAGLVKAFRDAASGEAHGDECPICAFLASQGHDVSHDHGDGGEPVLAWVSDDIETLLAPNRAEPGPARPPTFTKAQRRRFRRRLK